MDFDSSACSSLHTSHLPQSSSLNAAAAVLLVGARQLTERSPRRTKANIKEFKFASLPSFLLQIKAACAKPIKHFRVNRTANDFVGLINHCYTTAAATITIWCAGGGGFAVCRIPGLSGPFSRRSQSATRCVEHALSTVNSVQRHIRSVTGSARPSS